MDLKNTSNALTSFILIGAKTENLPQPKTELLLCPHTDMFIDCSLIGRIFIDANANKRIRV